MVPGLKSGALFRATVTTMGEHNDTYINHNNNAYSFFIFEIDLKSSYKHF